MPTLSALVLAGLFVVTASAGVPAPARFSWPLARELAQRLHPRSLGELESALRSADRAESAAAAAELCARGDHAGQSCAQAEKQAGSLPRRASLL